MNKTKVAILFLLSTFFAKAYWQQEVKYNIEVELIEEEHTLKAYEKLVYINHSPDTLNEMYFHLWPNAYESGTPLAKQILEDGNTKLYFQDKKYKGNLDGTRFKVNGKQVTLKQHPLGREVAWFDLKKPLLPGDTITIPLPLM